MKRVGLWLDVATGKLDNDRLLPFRGILIQGFPLG